MKDEVICASRLEKLGAPTMVRTASSILHLPHCAMGVSLRSAFRLHPFLPSSAVLCVLCALCVSICLPSVVILPRFDLCV
jgi:hypothetical protein